MRLFRNVVLVIGMVVGIGMPMLSPVAGAADDLYLCSNPINADSTICQNLANNKNQNFQDIVVNIINVVLYAMGSMAVLIIIIAGILYATSAGNDDAVKKAKNTLLYAVIGLVVTILAFAIVNFVTSTLIKPSVVAPVTPVVTTP
ncbi:MAG: pilin [Candidatus Saccharibacteria bacterium]